MKKIIIQIIVIFCFLNVSCAHRYGCVIDVKSMKHIEASNYLSDLNISGSQYQFNIYIDSRLCDDTDKENVLNEIFQEYAHKNGFSDFEVVNVYQTKMMDHFEYSVVFK